jgi:hypothetical protein
LKFNIHARLHLVLGILIATTLAILAISLCWNFAFFPPGFTGWGEVTREQTIAGWAIRRNDPSQRVEVQLYIDDQFAGYTVAEIPRPDVVQAGWTSDPRCGYVFTIPPLSAGDHEARVYALSRVRNGTSVTLQMTGNPLRFSVSADKTVTPSK